MIPSNYSGREMVERGISLGALEYVIKSEATPAKASEKVRLDGTAFTVTVAGPLIAAPLLQAFTAELPRGGHYVPPPELNDIVAQISPDRRPGVTAAREGSPRH